MAFCHIACKCCTNQRECWTWRMFLRISISSVVVGSNVPARGPRSCLLAALWRVNVVGDTVTTWCAVKLSQDTKRTLELQMSPVELLPCTSFILCEPWLQVLKYVAKFHVFDDWQDNELDIFATYLCCIFFAVVGNFSQNEASKVAAEVCGLSPILPWGSRHSDEASLDVL